MRSSRSSQPPSVGETTIPHALVRGGPVAPGAAVDIAFEPDAGGDVLGGEWLGVDQIETETSHGLRVNGAQAQDIDPMGRELDELRLARCPADQARVWSVAFSGAGRDYARVWAKGWLLTLLTLGLYYPWARAAKLHYLYRHTEVAGHPLAFHGQPGNMLRGFLISGALLLVYVCAGQWAAWTGVLAVLAVAGVWPALFLAAMRFRLAHTSWRGLPLGFGGNLAGAYQTLTAPLLISGLALTAMAWGVQDDAADNLWAWAAAGLWLTFGVALPFFYWQLKNYQHSHLRLGPLQTQWKATPEMIYGLLLRAALLWLTGPLVVAGVATLAALSVGSALDDLLQDPIGNAGLLLFVAAVLVLDTVIARAYVVVGMQNLVWTKTGNRYMRFRSDLEWGAYLRLQLRNHLLTALTLGAYWPWAAMATRRMRLQAITVVSRIVPEDLVASVQTRQGSAAAEVGTEMLGLDLGW
ncbi:DUF898 family protein [Aquabacterium sp.]|uniref:DUF898 family protein n=1 Tax=Aquabacterium sp. TaxID=1872578 RepID=UPI0035AE3AD2